MKELGDLTPSEVLFITIEREKGRARQDLPTILDLVVSLVTVAKLPPHTIADTKFLVETIKTKLREEPND
jgi:hypothetical protein